MFQQKLTNLFIFISITLLSQPFATKLYGQQHSKQLSFSEVHKEFPREEKNLRKWGAPVIADLDQDGFLDLLLNDHGFSIKVLWNNNGTFEKPYDLIMGDMHGIAIGDYDFDGNLELILARGGGSGSNARNSKIFKIDTQRNFSTVADFETPLHLMRGRTVKFIDGDNDGDLDLLNFAFPDAEKGGTSENYIYKNSSNHQLVHTTNLPAIKADGQKTLITDFNSDSIKDIILYGNGNIKIYKGNGDLSYTEVTAKVLKKDIDNVTGVAEIDFDNDGDFDLYFTRGKDFEIGETFYDASRKVLGFYTKRGPFKLDPLEAGEILNIENLQSQWPQKTLYIGESAYEYEFPGETHSGRTIRLVNSDALGFPDSFSKKGTYIGYIGNNKWMLAGDIWSPATGILHGIKNYTATPHPEGLNDMLLENKNGTFKEVTEKHKLSFKEHTAGITVADIDNNGYQDLILVPRGDLIHEINATIFLNKGAGVFTPINDHKVVSPELGAIGMGIEAFDYNNDGHVDLLLGHDRGKWHLFKNETTSTEHHYLKVAVRNSPSGKATALGAAISIKNCQNKQTRIVGATNDGYSQSFNNLIHFGLGTCKKPVSISITWSNGETLHKKVSQLNTRISLGSE